MTVVILCTLIDSIDKGGNFPCPASQWQWYCPCCRGGWESCDNTFAEVGETWGHISSVLVQSPKNSGPGQLVASTKLIVWDELPMKHHLCAKPFGRKSRTCASTTIHHLGVSQEFWWGVEADSGSHQRDPRMDHISFRSLKYSDVLHHTHRLQLCPNLGQMGCGYLMAGVEAIHKLYWWLQGRGTGLGYTSLLNHVRVTRNINKGIPSGVCPVFIQWRCVSTGKGWVSNTVLDRSLATCNKPLDHCLVLTCMI
jgi:hypothetical protein